MQSFMFLLKGWVIWLVMGQFFLSKKQEIMWIAEEQKW